MAVCHEALHLLSDAEFSGFSLTPDPLTFKTLWDEVFRSLSGAIKAEMPGESSIASSLMILRTDTSGHCLSTFLPIHTSLLLSQEHS